MAVRLSALRAGRTSPYESKNYEERMWNKTFQPKSPLTGTTKIQNKQNSTESAKNFMY
jgi:hypothetical protein